MDCIYVELWNQSADDMHSGNRGWGAALILLTLFRADIWEEQITLCKGSCILVSLSILLLSPASIAHF